MIPLLEKLLPFLSKDEETKTTESPMSDFIDIDNDYVDDIESFKYYNSRASASQHERFKREKQNQREIEKVNTLNSYISKWRKISLYPEVAESLEDITNSVIELGDGNGQNIPPLDFDEDLELNKQSVDKIIASYEKVLSLLNYRETSYKLVNRFLIDGRLQSEVIYEEGKESQGVYKVNIVTPINLTKVRTEDGRAIYTYHKVSSHFIEQEMKHYGKGHVYTPEQLVVVKSDLFDPGLKIYVSSLHKTLKTVNNLSQVEDSMVLVRFMKGVMLRIWNVNVGRMPATKAKAFLREVDKSINHDIAYDSDTGEFKTKNKLVNMFQDLIFPSRTNNDITKVETVDGDSSLLEGPDHDMFMKKLYKAMHIPVSRLPETPTIEFDSLDILKDEETFQKYVGRIRLKIQAFVFEIMKRDLLAQGLIKEEDWKDIRSKMYIKWSSSSNIVLRVKMELWQKRAETLGDLKESGLVGTVLSYRYVLKNILGLSEQEMEAEKDAIAKEKKESPDLYKKDEEE